MVFLLSLDSTQFYASVCRIADCQIRASGFGLRVWSSEFSVSVFGSTALLSDAILICVVGCVWVGQMSHAAQGYAFHLFLWSFLVITFFILLKYPPSAPDQRMLCLFPQALCSLATSVKHWQPLACSPWNLHPLACKTVDGGIYTCRLHASCT
eukprot:3542467-Rhodomonas_salina.1